MLKTFEYFLVKQVGIPVGEISHFTLLGQIKHTSKHSFFLNAFEIAHKEMQVNFLRRFNLLRSSCI